jgi:hypothetical protein
MTKTMLLVSREEADKLLDGQIAKAREMGKTLLDDHRAYRYLSHTVVEPELEKWTRRNIALMQKLFTTDEHVMRFQKFTSKLLTKMDGKEKTDHLLRLIEEQLTELESVKGCLDLYTVKTETTDTAKIHTPTSAKTTANDPMKSWSKSVEDHPLRYALLIVVATAFLVAGIMGWIQSERIANLTDKYEAEKQGMKNDYEAQIRELKAQINELQKQVQAAQPSPK